MALRILSHPFKLSISFNYKYNPLHPKSQDSSVDQDNNLLVSADWFP